MRNINYTILIIALILGIENHVLAGPAGLPKHIGDNDIVLHFDQPQIPISHYKFEQKDELKPAPNDFKLIEAAFMSNNIGERWAIVTIENTSSGRRLLKNDHIIATLANGEQTKAFDLNDTFEGGEVLTKAIHFGDHKFPIVQVKMR